MKGTCYTASECNTKGGTSGGNCAAGNFKTILFVIVVVVSVVCVVVVVVVVSVLESERWDFRKKLFFW
jgi:hypothetical protein